jgi:opacity protein-like surface antigen
MGRLRIVSIGLVAAGLVAAGLATAGLIATGAVAADVPGTFPLPPPVFKPAPVSSFGSSGWYLRGDLGYRWGAVTRAESVGGPANPTDNRLGNIGMVAAGVGIKTGWLRTDFTVDYAFPAKYRGTVVSPDDVTAKIRASSFLFNGYIVLGTWHGLTPYIGAGAGAAHVRLSDYQSLVAPPFTATSNSQWNAAYAAMAGVAIDVSPNMQVDVGYRYHNIGSIDSATDSFGSLTVRNVAAHEMRVGLRWYFNDLRDIR